MTAGLGFTSSTGEIELTAQSLKLSAGASWAANAGFFSCGLAAAISDLGGRGSAALRCTRSRSASSAATFSETFTRLRSISRRGAPGHFSERRWPRRPWSLARFSRHSAAFQRDGAGLGIAVAWAVEGGGHFAGWPFRPNEVPGCFGKTEGSERFEINDQIVNIGG